MAEYSIKAKVDQIVTKEVQLLVEASSEAEAMDKARAALHIYPATIEPGKGVKRILTVKSHYWIPRNIDFSDIKKET
jgi:hypothetical protein